LDRSLKGYQKRVVELERIKGWGSDVGTKIYYAILELAEAGQIWKHRENTFNSLCEILAVQRL